VRGRGGEGEILTGGLFPPPWSSAQEEVFTNISQQNSSPTPPAPSAPPAFSPSETSNTPDSEIIEVQWVAETTVVTEEAVGEPPSLEEVFGGAFGTFDDDFASSLIVPVTSTSLATDEVSQVSHESFLITDKLLVDATSLSIVGNDQIISGEILSVASVQELHLDVVDDTEAPETLEVAVKSIEQIFDDLPPIQEISTQTTELTSKSSTATKPPGESNSKASSTNLSVRVDLDRLERMNNLVGELAINRNGLSLQNEQLQGSVKELLNRFARVQNMVGNLRQLSDQMLVDTSSSGSMASNPGFLSVASSQWSAAKLDIIDQATTDTKQQTTNNSPFDSLELDTYGALHSKLQGLLEEMMQLEESVDDIVLFAKATDQTLEQQRQMVTQMRDELMWARMLPLGEVLNRFPRVLRDLSTTYHKPVSLKLSGSSVLVDKAVLEKLYDPLLHLLRNAFDHGIEFPELRRQRRKPEEGQIEIRAYHRGSQTIIEVSDDGQGLNTERIGRRAVELGLLSAEQLAVIPHNQLFEFVFEPGFSTASHVSELSGRGVGLDVVRSQLRSLKGTITVTSSPGKGTTFTLRLPLTLSVAKLLVCFVGSSALALPSDSIEEIVIPKSDQIKKSGTQQFLHWRGQIVPTYKLADFLSYACPMPETSPSKALISVPSPKNWALPMLVLKQGQQFFALEIDRLVTEQELVIKPFGEAIAPPSCTYGCTILGDGSLIPVIDAAVLLEQLLEQRTTATTATTGFNHRHAIESQETSATLENSSISNTSTSITTALTTGLIGTNRTSRTINQVKPTPTILVVDDAVALRRTLALTLERAGFRVLQARDGQEAIERLQQTSDAHRFATAALSVNLVVCDIEMPNMNGFEFLSQRRQEPELLKIPIVMLTSRSSDKHRWLAMQLGATAYFTKPYLEQDFVTAIKNIISQSTAQSLPAQS
jgi:chemotaxis family two-component system sensor histidine kinase/response regulator PixL